MLIQLNTDKNIDGNARLESYLNTLIKDELERFNEHITRIEVHLADENGPKKGADDIRCTLEARLENRQPIAVTSHANTIEKATSEALDKLSASIGKIVSKLKSH